MLNPKFLEIVMGPFEKQMEMLEHIGFQYSDDRKRAIYLPDFKFYDGPHGVSGWGKYYENLRLI